MTYEKAINQHHSLGTTGPKTFISGSSFDAVPTRLQRSNSQPKVLETLEGLDKIYRMAGPARNRQTPRGRSCHGEGRAGLSGIPVFATPK